MSSHNDCHTDTESRFGSNSAVQVTERVGDEVEAREFAGYHVTDDVTAYPGGFEIETEDDEVVVVSVDDDDVVGDVEFGPRRLSL